jgi:hypothetical protein
MYINPTIPSDAEADRLSLILLVEMEHLQFRFASHPETLPPLPEITTDETAFLNEFLGRNVIRIWEDLKAFVAQHETLIRELWKKAGRNQRAHILVAAWGTMPTCHSPDLVQLEKEFDEEYKGAPSGESEVFIFPHINIEDLQRTKPLLLLIESRSQIHPKEFLRNDWDCGAVGARSGRIKCAPLFGYKVDLLGREGSHYGKLWKDNQTYYEGSGCFFDNHLPPDTAIYLLHIQHRLLNFILRACRVIVSQKKLISKTKIRTETILSSLNDINPGEWATGMMETFEKPYSAPRKYDFWRMKHLFRARLRTAEEHVLNLKEDPEYFFSTLKTIMDNDPHANSSDANQLLAGDSDPKWTRCMGKLAEESHTALLTWHMLCSMLEKHIANSQTVNIDPLAEVVSIPEHVAVEVHILWEA